MSTIQRGRTYTDAEMTVQYDVVEHFTLEHFTLTGTAGWVPGRGVYATNLSLFAMHGHAYTDPRILVRSDDKNAGFYLYINQEILPTTFDTKDAAIAAAVLLL